MSGAEVTRPVLRYFGGKWMLAPWITSHFPPHRIYVEAFGGGASVLLRKPRSWAEVYNDLDGEIVNVFRVVQTRPRELERLLAWTPFARAEFDMAHEPSDDPVEQARRSIIRSFMGHGADSLTRGSKSGFRANSNHRNQGRNAAADWANYLPALPAIRDRLTGVIVENRDAKAVMAGQDSPETLHFVDPPYPWATRSEKRHGYRHEMTDQEHLELIAFLRGLRGMVILCGYPGQLYGDLEWERREVSAFADGAAKRTEVLWLNPACARAQAQMSLI